MLIRFFAHICEHSNGCSLFFILFNLKLKSVMLGFVSFKYHAGDVKSFGRLYSYDDENDFREYVRVMQKTGLIIEKTIPCLENVIFS